MRHFAYSDGLLGSLRPYALDAAPLVTAAVEVYPLAGTKRIDPGLVAGYAGSFALASSSADTGKVTTRWRRAFAAARVRARTGSQVSPLVGVTVGYGEELFAFDTAANAALPSVDYRFVRAGADVRVPLGRFALFANCAYMFVTSAGETAARFPRASVAGIEGDLGGAFSFGSFEARLTASYRRFFYAMHPQPGDAYVAGGAVDELSGLQASLAYAY